MQWEWFRCYSKMFRCCLRWLRIADTTMIFIYVYKEKKLLYKECWVLWGSKGCDRYMDFPGSCQLNRLIWLKTCIEEVYLAANLGLCMGCIFERQEDTDYVTSRTGYTSWWTCAVSWCGTFKQLCKQQTMSLYILHCTTTFLLHFGMSVHEIQNAKNLSGLSFFEQKVVRFCFLWHQHWGISPWAARWS